MSNSVTPASRLIYQVARTGDVGVAPGAEQLALAAEGAGAEAERGDAQIRCAEMTVSRCVLPEMRVAADYGLAFRSESKGAMRNAEVPAVPHPKCIDPVGIPLRLHIGL